MLNSYIDHSFVNFNCFKVHGSDKIRFEHKDFCVVLMFRPNLPYMRDRNAWFETEYCIGPHRLGKNKDMRLKIQHEIFLTIFLNSSCQPSRDNRGFFKERSRVRELFCDNRIENIAFNSIRPFPSPLVRWRLIIIIIIIIISSKSTANSSRAHTPNHYLLYALFKILQCDICCTSTVPYYSLKTGACYRSLWCFIGFTFAYNEWIKSQ